MKNEAYFEYIKTKPFPLKLKALADAAASMERHSYESAYGPEGGREWHSNEYNAQMDRANFLFRHLSDEYTNNNSNTYENSAKYVLSDDMYKYIKEFCTKRTNKYGISKTTCKGCKYRYRGESKYTTCMFGNMPESWKEI